MVFVRITYKCDYIYIYTNNKNSNIIVVKKKNISKAYMRNIMKRKARFLIKLINESYIKYNYTVIINKFHDIKLDEYKKISNYIIQCAKKQY